MKKPDHVETKPHAKPHTDHVEKSASSTPAPETPPPAEPVETPPPPPETVRVYDNSSGAWKDMPNPIKRPPGGA